MTIVIILGIICLIAGFAVDSDPVRQHLGKPTLDECKTGKERFLF
jgi:hypothetical protein